MDKKKKNKVVNYIIFGVLILILLVPQTRVWVQQGLMKIGLFRPSLEQPVGDDAAEALSAAFISHDTGEELRTDALKGKVLFINFWATWCPPCRAEMPSIQSLYNNLQDNPDIEFLLVEIDGAKEKTIEFMEKENLSLPIYYPNSQIPGQWLKGSIPTTVILDKEGKIAAKQEGMADYSKKEVAQFLIDLTK